MRLAILSMALGAFAVGLTEFAVTGLLPQVAAELSVSVPAADANCVTPFSESVTDFRWWFAVYAKDTVRVEDPEVCVNPVTRPPLEATVTVRVAVVPREETIEVGTP